MEIHQLRYLVALAEEASFSRAATRLGVAQPSLSQQIKKLESDLGRPLVDRLPGRVVPTAAGHRLLAQARLILAHVADAQRQLGDADGQPTGSLAVGAIPTIAPFVLPAVLAEFARRFPAVQTRIVEDVTDRLVEMVERGDLDLAILSTHGGGRTVHVEPLATEPLWLMVAPDHRLAKRKTVAWSEISKERLLVLHEMHCLSGQVSRLCKRREVTAPVVMRGAQLATIAAMVGRGLGVSIVPEMMRAADASHTGVYVRLAPHAPRRELAVAWSLLRYRSTASRALVEILRETFTTPRAGASQRTTDDAPRTTSSKRRARSAR
jgi:LysR family hydrogen peroxide-inducible transcriptional activator